MLRSSRAAREFVLNSLLPPFAGTESLLLHALTHGIEALMRSGVTFELAADTHGDLLHRAFELAMRRNLLFVQALELLHVEQIVSGDRCIQPSSRLTSTGVTICLGLRSLLSRGSEVSLRFREPHRGVITNALLGVRDASNLYHSVHEISLNLGSRASSRELTACRSVLRSSYP
jgi:hypothetical protein